MGVPSAAAAGPVTSTSGATRIVLLVNCVSREELLDEEYDPTLQTLEKDVAGGNPESSSEYTTSDNHTHPANTGCEL